MPSSIPEKGINDLETKFPKLAAEADGWDPSTVTYGSGKKMPWKCKEGDTWKATLTNRTSHGLGCPICAEYGFNPEKPAWFYLMRRKNEQQIGITNDIITRMQTHKSKGWKEVDKIGPKNGQLVLNVENELKRWLKEKIGLAEGTKENWFTTNMEVHSLAELTDKSGIETSFFA